ncbi:hypothetical protein [Cohnella sp. GCM10027633]|uniref:hypothetical protein n=1 Tax=unclassified Cohnella TaxID=2636738 RepID=UPI00362B4204
MSDKSPLFVSSLELVAHATELYTKGNPKKYKFVILHLANSIELILKDLLIDKGISIYKGRSTETVSVWTAFDELNNVGVIIKERPIIELLIDDRNTIQHRFGYPNAETVYYYLEVVIKFFKTFLEEQYDVKLSEALEPHLSLEDMQFLGLIEDGFLLFDKLFKISPESAVIQAYQTFEKEFVQLIHDHLNTDPYLPLLRNPLFMNLLVELQAAGYIQPDSIIKFNILRQNRNIAAHSTGESDNNSMFEALKIAKELLTGFRNAQNDKYINDIKLKELTKPSES